MKKQAPARAQVHHAGVRPLPPEHVEVELGRAAALEGPHGLSAARDERWSYGPSPAQPRWGGHALAHHPGQGWADVCGRRQATVFVALTARGAPWGIPRSCTDGWGTSARQGEAEQPPVGKAPTQTSERQHSTWRPRSKRVVRRTLCCAKTARMHDGVSGLCIKR